MLTTVVTAAFDEIHQTFIPSRSGRWQDVVLDTVGAAVLQVVVYLLSTRVVKQRQVTAPLPELTSTR
jgi:VanZ family protein